MVKRTIEISREPVYLSVRHGQLVVQPRGTDRAQARTIPCEDIGVVLIDEPGTTLSHAALVALVECGAAVVICGRDHLPVGMLLPLSTHTEVVVRINEQIAVNKPLKKRLWKQLVTAKIRAQAENLELDSPKRRKLLALARGVRSGDPSNVEAQAAKVYWSAWLSNRKAQEGKPFRRDAKGAPPNNLLNYGYAVLRAAIARALVAAGLNPVLGIHHSNRSNPFCLADDLLEPLRPIVDARARDLFLNGSDTLDQPTKASLLELLAERACTGDEHGPLMVALHRMVASLVHCFAGTGREIVIPVATVDGR